MKKFILVFFAVFLTACASTGENTQPSAVPDVFSPTDTKEIPTATLISSPTNSFESPTPTVTKEFYWWEHLETISFAMYTNVWNIYLVSLDGLYLETFAPKIVGSSPIWSPDGKKIAFYSSGIGIYVLDIYSGEFVSIPSRGDDRIYIPSWSPDGTQLAFASNAGIRIDNLNGDEVLTIASTDYFDVKWSPDGSYLVIEEFQNEDLDLYLYSFSDNTIFPVAVSELMELKPSWSPDGTRIAYIRQREGGEGSDLFIYDVETRETIRLTDSDAVKYRPAWSPDGSMIAFEHQFLPLLKDVYIINSTGGNPIQITNFAGGESFPEWSNDGQKIAFEFISEPDREEELSAGKVPMEPSGIWVYDFELDSFMFIEGSEDGMAPVWRPVSPSGNE